MASPVLLGITWKPDALDTATGCVSGTLPQHAANFGTLSQLVECTTDTVTAFRALQLTLLQLFVPCPQGQAAQVAQCLY